MRSALLRDGAGEGHVPRSGVCFVTFALKTRASRCLFEAKTPQRIDLWRDETRGAPSVTQMLVMNVSLFYCCKDLQSCCAVPSHRDVRLLLSIVWETSVGGFSMGFFSLSLTG